MEEEIARLKKANADALGAVETWKTKALRPGNKRGSVAVTPSLVPRSRMRTRLTPTVSPPFHKEQAKQAMAEQEHEIELLKKWRLRNLNGRREAEQELDRLKEHMANLEVKKTPMATNLRARLEKVVTADKGKKPATLGMARRESTLQCQRKILKYLKKDEILTICNREDVNYVTLEKTKEEIAQKRADAECRLQSANLGASSFTRYRKVLSRARMAVPMLLVTRPRRSKDTRARIFGVN
ncbi:hypothetical protein CBR_g55414 [Chara braunii]|uniref:Uncharacterized protein n=1 Tax=Chara braunii TaxID=69332 RepID=A0A388K7Q8_CHABU|nr:hypothetical protein CBR_g55414 [Chara braunii]|eukprot:GBG66071.1 hypothetical protein CBR_g55414 [Chara braunii]